MGRVDKPIRGLLKSIVDAFYEHGQDQAYDSDQITAYVAESGYWDEKKVKTPERTVNSYVAKYSDFFIRVESNRYRLSPNYYRPSGSPAPTDPANTVLLRKSPAADDDTLIKSDDLSAVERIIEEIGWKRLLEALAAYAHNKVVLRKRSNLIADVKKWQRCFDRLKSITNIR